MGKKFLSNKMQGVIPVIHAWRSPFYLEQIAGYDLQVKFTPADVVLLTQHQHKSFAQIAGTHFEEHT